jgi:hypothetical protein
VTRLACPACRALIDAPRDHGVAVDCHCGAELVVRADVAGFHLRERIVDRPTIALALAHLRPDAA